MPNCLPASEQELFIPFRIYNDIYKQNRYKKHCQKVHNYELITPKNKLLPFIIIRSDDKTFPTSIKIFSYEGVEALDVTTTLVHDLLTDDVNQYMFYYGTVIQGMNLTCSFYYLEITWCETEKYYSEVFAPKNFLSNDTDIPYLLLEWKHSVNIENIIYQTGYVNRLYVNSFLAEPEYELEQEGDENGDKEFTPTFQRGIKKYKLELSPVPEFINDCMFYIDANDTKNLYANNYEIIDFKDAVYEPKWQDTGCLSTGVLTFRKYNIIKSRLCKTPLVLDIVREPVNCGDFAGYTLQQVIDAGVRLKDVEDCLLDDFII